VPRLFRTPPSTSNRWLLLVSDRTLVSSGKLAQTTLAPQIAPPPPPVLKDNFREIQVKVHVRTPGKDTWAYQGRGVVTQEITGHSSRVGKPLRSRDDREICLTGGLLPRSGPTTKWGQADSDIQ
jgi:hypothetical protein